MTKEEIIRGLDNMPLNEMEELRDYISIRIQATKRLHEGKSPLRCSCLMRVMADVMGERFIPYVSRLPEYVWARTMVAYQMKREGYSTLEIGDQMFKNHSSITHALKKMENVFALPKAYKDIHETWNKFQNEIQL